MPLLNYLFLDQYNECLSLIIKKLKHPFEHIYNNQFKLLGWMEPIKPQENVKQCGELYPWKLLTKSHKTSHNIDQQLAEEGWHVSMQMKIKEKRFVILWKGHFS